MQSLTLAIAISASVLSLVLQPIYAFVVYVALALWYPSYLVVQVGTLDISALRIVGSILLLRCLFNPRIRSQFVWSCLDTWVAISMIIYVGMYCFTRPLYMAIENRGGFLTDTLFAYLVARLCITDREGLTTILKWIGFLLVPLAILGVIETFTGWQPYWPLLQLCPWRPDVHPVEPRSGLFRAIGPFGHPIMFGCCFAMFLPLISYLRHEQNHWRLLAYIISAIIIIGCLSSMSSGSWGMLMVTIFCMAMEKRKRWVKRLLKFFILSCFGIEIISNRHFYHVIFSYANPVGGAWWHRARLIDCAIMHFDEWWLAGYGGKDPGWGGYLGMTHTDVTNQFILHGIEYGLLGMIALCIVLAIGFRNIISTYKRTADPRLKSLCWFLGCMLFSIIVSWLSVSYFGQMINLFYSMLGAVGSITTWQNSAHNWRKVTQSYLSTNLTTKAIS